MTRAIIYSNRKGWIDALRGLAILLVVYGHNIQNMPDFFIFTSPVKMPLFFAISGYVFSYNNKHWAPFLISLFKKLVIPWVILGLFFPILIAPFKGLQYPMFYFMKMLSGDFLWFMPCFVIAEIIHYIILRYCNNNIGIIVVSFLCFAFGLVFHANGVLDYAMFNRALTVQPFFLIGQLFRENESRIIRYGWYWFALLAIIYFAMCFFSKIIYPGQLLDVHLNRYYNIPYCLLLIFVRCFLLFSITCKLDFKLWIMSFIGQNTLVIYIWHGMAINFLIKIMQIVGWSIPINGWTSLLKTIWAILLCGGCAILINMFIPFVVGKKKQ